MSKTKRETGWVYIIGPGAGEPFKVGRTYSVENRLNNLQSGNHLELKVHVAFETTGPAHVEYQVASIFEASAIRGEWFNWCPEVEALIARLVGGCAKTFTRFSATGNLRLVDRYDNSAAKRIASNKRRLANYHAAKELVE